MPAGDDIREISHVLDTFTKTSVDYRGRIYIPKKCRKAFGTEGGDTVYIEQEKDCFRVHTTKSLRNRHQ